MSRTKSGLKKQQNLLHTCMGLDYTCRITDVNQLPVAPALEKTQRARIWTTSFRINLETTQ